MISDFAYLIFIYLIKKMKNEFPNFDKIKRDDIEEFLNKLDSNDIPTIYGKIFLIDHLRF